MSRRNVVILHTDQQRYDSLGCTGNRFIDTPHIDRLAAEGTLFTRHIAANPVCTPSRCSLMTGLYPPGHGVWANGIALPRREHEQFQEPERWMIPPAECVPEPPTMADRFAAAGYHTAAFGKLHLEPSMAHPDYPYRDTVAVWQSGVNDDWHGPYYGFEHVELTQGHGESPCLLGHYANWLRKHHPDVQRKVRAGDKVKRPEGKAPVYQSVVPAELHNSNWLADRFIAYLDEAGSEPFFAFVGFPDPHLAIAPSFDLAERYEDRAVLPPIDPDGVKQFHMGRLSKSEHLDDEDRQNIRRYTNAMVHGIDLAVGKITAALETKGLLDDTVIVFTSDHGDFLCDHGLLWKENIAARPLVHVPCIIRAAGAALPASWGRPMSNVDVLPTAMALAGLDAPQDIHGVNVAAEIARGGGHQAFVYAFHEVPEYHNVAVYEGDWELLYYPKIDRAELYNLATDPHEMIDLAVAPEQRGRLLRLIADAGAAFLRHCRGIGHRVSPW